MKRVVTGHDSEGRSIFTETAELTSTVEIPNVVTWYEAWASFADDTIPIDTASTEMRSSYSERHPVFPANGASCFRVLDFIPSDEPPDPAVGAAAAQQLPGLAGHLEAEDPGMHPTDSIDYGVILSGRITLELDDGRSETLEAGDVFVQNGTRHAWRVTEPCRMAVVLVGIPRSQPS